MDLIWKQVEEIGVWQMLAFVFGVAQVCLAWANRVMLYPAGIFSTAISSYVLWSAGLYAESALNVYYVVVSVYGWWRWADKKNDLPISRCTQKDWRVTVLIALFGFVFIRFILKNYTPSDVPNLDAFVSAVAWAGTWLLTQRKIENWMVLNISNAVAIPLLWYKGLPLFSLLTVILFVVAVFGFVSWRKNKTLRSNQIQI